MPIRRTGQVVVTLRGQATRVAEATVDRQWRMLIGGRLTEAISGDRAEVTDPARGRAVTDIPMGGPEDVDAAVGAATAAFDQWRDVPATERASAVLALAAAVEEHGEELAWLDTIDG